ncbi:CubicO group peptidase, beta-lactamase class C family [Parasphingorhabdus marina DSM 22363]|uniref:CubicO group peptidase, beta-lactamase class C family n=1 Tax=Parasphingorhabdus marina DSM 22363 TaxID=1123272 RepID=A0A1N6CRR3_9SPHN|nr:serine hydrolase domain-containing protein [Parasphingorhabdus marina]SIN61084.1 CubicO group peptidase, beta-lactamase class C family [Parasphingorhabdus marina DSM 22363]
MLKTAAALILSGSLSLAAPTALAKDNSEPAPVNVVGLQATMDKVADKANVGGIGMAIIRDGDLVHTLYAGEAEPGVPVSQKHWFNTASVAKTLIAETVLRLVARDAMGLDDPVAEHYRHPDLADDPRYALLTPRIILSHQTTLKNWPNNYEDGQLAFQGEPGDGQISYSGAGVEILMRYLEQRFGKTYPELVDAELLAPLGIKGVRVGRSADVEVAVTRGINKDGEWQDAFRRSQGGSIIERSDYSAADNMYATVPGYAALLSAIIANRNLPERLATERRHMLSSGSKRDMGYDCPPNIGFCPDRFGYGLGWAVFEHEGQVILNHGGNDFAEHAQVWFDTESGNGMVLFMTGGNAFRHGLEIIAAVDPDLPLVRYYSALIALMESSGGN